MARTSLDVGLQESKVRDSHVIYFPTKLERNHFDCKLTLGSHYIDASEKIISFLNENELEQLVQQTQFGNLIRCAKDYMNSNQLLWFLMSRQSLDCGDNEFWMVFRKKPIRFSMIEYCLITGLDCSQIYPPIPSDNSFLRRHFRGKYPLSMRDLKAKIDGFGNGEGEEVDVEKLKLASLYFLATVLGPQRKNRNEVVSADWVRLVEDFESFNKYPWGRVAFDEVLFGLKKDLAEKFTSFKNLANRRKNDEEFSGYGSFHISGFIHPLQILAYEYFPSVVDVFATRRDEVNVPLPRMCHWVTKKWKKNHSPSMEDVTKAFSCDPEEATVGMLTPTNAELLSAHYLSGDFVDSSPHAVTLRISELMSQGVTVVCSEYPLSDQVEDEEMADISSEATPTRTDSGRPSTDRVVRTYSRKRRASILQEPLRSSSPRHDDRTQSSSPHRTDPSPSATYEVRLTRFEDSLTALRKEQADGLAKMMESMTNMQKDLMSSMTQMIEDAIARAYVRTDAETVGVVVPEVDVVGATITRDVVGDHVDRETGEKTVEICETEAIVGRLVDVGTGAEHIGDILTEGSSAARVDVVGATVNALTFEQRINKTVERSWSRIKLEIEHVTETSTKSGLVGFYGKQWFVDLMTPGCWLHDDHFQECLRGLLELQKKYPHAMSNTVSLMDIDFHQIVTGAFHEGGPSNIENLMVYAKAGYSWWPTVPWDKANLILIPFHIPGHWVMLTCVPKIIKISVLDSDRSVDRSGKKLHECIRPIALMIPHMVVAMGMSDDLAIPWDIVRPEDFPVQKKSGECGVYAIAAAALTMASSGNAYALDDEKVSVFRRFFSCCVWDNNIWSLD